MQRHADHHVIQGNIEVLEQGLGLLRSLSDEQYTCIVSAFVGSSIGQHFRHILDLYHAVMQPTGFVPWDSRHKPLLDYDSRRRGALVETCRRSALDELGAIKRQLQQQRADLDLAVGVKTEVCHHRSRSVTLDSTLARELAFASCHATHHYAMVAVIAKLQGAKPDPGIGLAPASATFTRQQRLETAAG